MLERSTRASSTRVSALAAIRALLGTLGRSARAVERQVNMTNAQLFVLQQIGTGPVTATALAEQLRMRRNAVSMVVARLVGASLVKRTRSDDDGRHVWLTITARGKRVIQRAPEPPTARLIGALGAMSAPDVAQLDRGLSALLIELEIDPSISRFLFEPARSSRRIARMIAALLPIGAGVLGAGCRDRDAAAATRTPAAAAAAELPALMADAGNWASYGRDYTNQRFSPLSSINTATVAQLAPAWTYHTGIVESFETSPIVVGRTMYLTTAKNHVVALDAATGAKKWEYAHALQRTVMCCGPNNRGVAYSHGRVYMGTLDARLVALDTATGQPAWTVQVADNTAGYSITHAPVAVNGLVIVGLAGAEYGIRGSVVAYDENTGAERWRWYTIPSPDEGGWWGKFSPVDAFGDDLHRDLAQEHRDSAAYADAWKRGGGSMWQAPAVDTARGLLIFTVGNASPDIDGHVRPGDNLYTNCIVALDVSTGRLKWYFQEVPHDVWDYDAVSPVVLMDVKDTSGRIVPAAAQAGKTGWVYVLNRETGAPIRRSDPFVPHQDMFSLPTRTGTRVLPGGNGGSEWSPTAYSPRTGYMYVLGLNEHQVYKLRPEKYRKAASYLTGVWYSVEPARDNGTFSAVDLATGRLAWLDTLPDPMVGGALATAGDVVFVGTKDQRLLAFDARTGVKLWQFAAGAGVNAPPISYQVDGRQFVAVAAGGNFQINAKRGDALIAFALPARSPRP
jgi:PQQ-dependent dehydrogenase (methanol/ethanol family)